MRFLALDLGDKRTGLALGDDESGLAFPAEVVEQAVSDRAAWVARIARAIGAYGPDALVVGLPLNMDGSEGPRAALARELAEALRERTGLAAHFQDERLTTEEARWRMSGSKPPYSRHVRWVISSHPIAAWPDVHTAWRSSASGTASWRVAGWSCGRTS